MVVADAKQAVRSALNFFRESGVDPDAKDLRAEELVLSEDDSTWEVTLSYVRPSGSDEDAGTSPIPLLQQPFLRRIFKTFTIRSSDGKVVSMRIRTLANAR